MTHRIHATASRRGDARLNHQATSRLLRRPGAGHFCARGPAADVVIVGGGIAGSALATVLARNGQSVTVLEQQRTYTDRVRGEFMAPWGVATAQRLGLLHALAAAGGVFPRWSIKYDETISPAHAEAAKVDQSTLLPGVAGPLCMHQPLACEVLNQQAQQAGARVVRGVDHVRIQAGREPMVRYRLDGRDVELRCRLIIGADGRSSTVRQQACIQLHHAEETNLVVGLLVDGAADWPQDTYALGTEGDRMYLIFPQGGDRVRLYLCISPQQRARFAGPDGPARFLDSFQLQCVPGSAMLAHARPIGPCATWSGEDTWTDAPLAEGVVLIGDAAGYNGPIVGQGLSLSLRDVEVVSDLLLRHEDWSPATFQPYVQERWERMRRVRFSAALYSDLFCAFGPEGAQRRGAFFGRMASRQEPTMNWVVAPIVIGPDKLPPDAYSEEFRQDVLSSGTLVSA